MSRRDTEQARRLSRISRRGLLGSGAAASVLAASGLSAATPRPGGTLRIAAPGPALFDRLLAPGAAFDCLTEIDGDGGLRGELAQSWETPDGGVEWVFTLRPDAMFHGGMPVRAEDVVEAMKAHADGGALGDLQRVWRAGEHRVGFRLAAADPQFPLRLADPALVVRLGQDGSGLYAVQEESPGRRVKLARVEGHGRAVRGGWFDRVELLEVLAAEERLSMLISGRVDLAFGLSPQAHRALARERRLVATTVQVALPDGPHAMLAGHVTRLKGLDGRDPLRIAERGFFA